MRPSLSRAITRACTSEPRLSLTITAHPVVAVVVMVVGPTALRLWGAQDQCSIPELCCLAQKAAYLWPSMTNRRPGPELDGWPLTRLLFLQLPARTSHSAVSSQPWPQTGVRLALGGS